MERGSEGRDVSDDCLKVPCEGLWVAGAHARKCQPAIFADVRLSSACIHFCQNPSLSWNKKCMWIADSLNMHFFTPAGADEHPLAGGGVGDGSIVMDEGRVEGHAIDIQGHRWKLDAEWKMMPLTVTHLFDGDKMRSTWDWKPIKMWSCTDFWAHVQTKE